MSIMMSDSLKDIVSIGQLTGEYSTLTLHTGNDSSSFDIYSFTFDEKIIRVLAFSSRDFIAQLIKMPDIKASASFEGVALGSGRVICCGYEPIIIDNSQNDMLMVHIKRDT